MSSSKFDYSFRKYEGNSELFWEEALENLSIPQDHPKLLLLKQLCEEYARYNDEFWSLYPVLSDLSELLLS